ncbi:hypothetical protein N657DRAFT_372260 [Parathielavia appendiculata]|uniref:Uncharacterized protein n=1 Tax=Parathielavia appendiculata TaxID=2587402 RepID=A0AAN6TQW5_9PEZI|nr:hypothetical protein N657DRAFT_372260 [Parathielavia appendiculata]
MLLNWDANELYLSPLTAGLPRGIDLLAAKNLVLELTYSVAHRVQALVQELCDQTMRSMSRADEHQNPVTLCCALWIVFTATHKFEKRNFTATSLANLRNFLSKLHERSRAAIQAINHHKWMASARCCGHARDNQGDFAKLIAEAKRPKATVSFAFERHVADTTMLQIFCGGDILNSGFRPQRYLKFWKPKHLSCRITTCLTSEPAGI